MGSEERAEGGPARRGAPVTHRCRNEKPGISMDVASMPRSCSRLVGAMSSSNTSDCGSGWMVEDEK